jgi:hypothetical protein
VTVAAVGYTIVEQFLPAAVKAVAIVLLAGAAVAAAHLAWATMRDASRKGDDR